MNFNRRRFLEVLALAGITLPNISVAQEKEANEAEGEFSFLVPAYLQNQTETGVSIFTILSKEAFAWLEILDNAGNVHKKIYQSEDGMINANTDFFHFTIEDAPRSFRYRIKAKEVQKFDPYKIVYGQEIETPIFEAKLAKSDQEQIRCLVYNDVHEEKSSYHDLIPNQDIAPYDFFVINGDSFHYVTNQQDITEKLLKPIEFFATSKPFIMNRGNHETRGSFARNFKRYFGYPDNKYYQAFKRGPIFWIMLDSGEDKPDNHEVYAGTVDYDNYRKEQAQWLEQVLQSKERKRAQHTVVISHIPIFHSDDWHGTLDNRACFHPLFQKYKIDAMISGHTHQYGYYSADKDHNYPVFIGGGPKAGKRTIIDVAGNNKSLNIRMTRDDGTELGLFKK
ncbi:MULTISPECIES: metallophosphoesterase family protein [Sphingobacterium]|jgi:acid phosphatase type 7|uniref:metallophosphoesterase family protein n=1 Tax=Sphingobacterium TaxID=28453 RepID=UPI00257CE3F6|nr:MULTISPECIES: metallophosphoesterase [Sphingobacterium]